MSNCAEVVIAQENDRALSPGYGLNVAPEGWVADHLLTGLIGRLHRLDQTLIVTSVAHLLAREAPDWFVQQIEPQYRADGTPIGPYCAIREDSAEWLVSVCVKIRDLLDREIAEVTGRPVSDPMTHDSV